VQEGKLRAAPRKSFRHIAGGVQTSMNKQQVCVKQLRYEQSLAVGRCCPSSGDVPYSLNAVGWLADPCYLPPCQLPACPPLKSLQPFHDPQPYSAPHTCMCAAAAVLGLTAAPCTPSYFSCSSLQLNHRMCDIQHKILEPSTNSS